MFSPCFNHLHHFLCGESITDGVIDYSSSLHCRGFRCFDCDKFKWHIDYQLYQESTESEMQVTCPSSMSRNRSTTTQGNVLNFLNGLLLNSKLLAPDKKSSKQVDVNRTISGILGASSCDPLPDSLSASSMEELKSVKSNLHDYSVMGMERVKTLTEVISKIDKNFVLPPRRRPRSSLSSSEHLNDSLQIDPILGGSIAKVRIQNRVISNGFGPDAQKMEKKSTNVAQKKRSRATAMDVQIDLRADNLAKPPGAMDADKYFSVTNTLQCEEKDCTISNSEVWEKTRMKRRRSGIKPEISKSSVLEKSPNGDQESKWDMHKRLTNDIQSRSGIPNGGVGVEKLDMNFNKTGFAMRSVSTINQDNDSQFSDKRDHSVGVDKEKVNAKVVNINSNSADLTSTTKANIASRGALSMRSSLLNVPESVGQADEKEVPKYMDKLHVVGASNRKCNQSTQLSSPSVVQIAVQRPKVSRVARRSNLIPLASSQDESSLVETLPTASADENGLGSQRSFSSTSLKQVKSNNGHFSSAILRKEASRAARIESKCKGRSSDDEKESDNVQKVLNMPPRKNIVLNEDLGLGDAARKQGRQVRGSTPMKLANPVAIQKLENSVTVKQLGSVRPGSDKIEGKTGGPLPKKISHRKAYTSPRHAVNTGASERHGESDVGHAELLAAAKDAIDLGQAYLTTFWKKVDVVFGRVTDEDITFMKQQTNIGSRMLSSKDGTAHRDGFSNILNADWLNECEGDTGFTSEAKSLEPVSEQPVPETRAQNVLPLYQRLISALIPEEEIEGLDSNFELDAELRCDSWTQHSLGNIQTVGRPASNGYRITATPRFLDKMETDELVYDDNVADTGMRKITNSDQEAILTESCTQYNQMSMDGRLLLELQSIGFFPEPLPNLSQREDEIAENTSNLMEKFHKQPNLSQREDEIAENTSNLMEKFHKQPNFSQREDEIVENPSNLMEKFHKQVLKKKNLLYKLEKSVLAARDIQQRDIERRAYENLVWMGYEKYMACQQLNTSRGNGMNNRIAKRAASVFFRWTLKQYRMFEKLGESCFKGPEFVDVFHSMPSLNDRAELFASITEGKSSKEFASSRSHYIPSMHSKEKFPSNDCPAANNLSEQPQGNGIVGSSRMIKGELDVDGTSSTLRIGRSLLNGAKGKRSGRERNGKQNRRMESRSGIAKSGEPALSCVKEERKSKAKAKQKISHLSTLVNDLEKASQLPEVALPSGPESRELMTDDDTKKDDFGLDMQDSDALSLSNLQFPDIDMDGLGDPADFESWLNVNDDDGMQDQDFVGLHAPMDDLSEIL